MNLVPAFRHPNPSAAHAPCSNDRNIHDDYLGTCVRHRGSFDRVSEVSVIAAS